MRRLHFTALLTLLLCCGPVRAVLPPSASFMSRPAIIPFEIIRSGHIAIHAMINGHGPYRFIFDTGAPMLLVSEHVAKDAKILPGDFQRPFFTPLGNLGEFRIKSVVMGRALQPDLTTDVWNHPTVEELSRAFGRFEGLIGYPFFAHYQVTIDYKSRTMTLVPSLFQPTDTRLKMTRRMTEGSDRKFFSPTEMIGIQVTKTSSDQAAGVLITGSLPHGPGDEAGIETGDRLLTLDGRWTDSIQDCYAALSTIDSARPVPMTVQRGSKEMTVFVKLKPGI